MEPLRVALFGGVQLSRGSEAVPPIPSRVARSLFARLVTDRGVAHPRERLAAEFWPELSAAHSRRRLSHALWQLQDALGELVGDLPYLDVTPETLAFSDEIPCWLDVEEFEDGLDVVRGRRVSGAPAPVPAGGATARRLRDLRQLERVVELYRGEFLAGHYDEWALGEQERLRQRYLDALTLLVTLAKEHGAHDDALLYAKRLTNEDPLREDGHREVMRLSMLLGRPVEALRQYERCREVLAEELATVPDEETEDLHRRIRRQQRGGGGAAPAHRDVVAPPPGAPLVGRDHERGLVVAVLEQALAGTGGAVFVEGNPGIGKSRLLAEVVDDANWRGFTTLQAVCPRAEESRPYVTLQRLLEPTLTPLRVEQLRHRLEPVWLAQAAVLLPQLRQAVPSATPPLPSPHPLPAADGAQRVREALSQLVLAIASIGPVSLVVDDVHAIDLESLAVIEDVAGQLRDRQLLVLFAYRGEDARGRPALWEGMREIDLRARPQRVLLRPLDTASTAELLRSLGRGATVSPRVLDRVQRETGGNPLFVVETIRSLAEGDLLGRLEEAEGGEDLPLPHSIRETVLTRLERLPLEPRTALDTLAVAGDGTGLSALADAVELPGEVVVDAVGALVRVGLVHENGDRFGIGHDQIRRIVLDVLPDETRHALHARIAAALEAHEPTAVQRLAFHYEAAGIVRKAVHYLQLAARDAARVHAYATADDRYQRAVELQGGSPTSIETRFALLAEHEAVLLVLGERDRQREILAQLHHLAAGRAEHEVEVSCRQAMLHAHLGELHAAIAHARRAVERAEKLADEDLLGSALVALGTSLAWAGKPEEAVPVLVRAGERAEGTAGEAEVRTLLASMLRQMQRYDAAEEELRTAVEVARRYDDLREEARAIGALGAIRMETGVSVQAAELYGEAIDRCRTIGFRHGEATNRVNLANVLYTRGEVAAALAAYGEAGTIFARLGDRRGEAMVRLNAGLVRHRVVGDDDVALAELTSALDYLESVHERRLASHCRVGMAGIAIRRDRLDEAAAHLEAAAGVASASDDAWLETQRLERAAQLRQARGELEEAVATVSEAIDLALRHGLVDQLSALRGLLGELLIDLGDPGAALKATRSAVGNLRPGVERDYLVRYQHHRALEANGFVTPAAQELERARAKLGAVLDALDPEQRQLALDVPEHVAIVGAGPGADRRRTLRVAATSAARGRTLRPTELVEVTVEIGARTGSLHDPVEERRAALSDLIEQIGAQGGSPTIADLAGALEVSQATVRRDIATLRSRGSAIVTRGHRTG